MALVDWLALVGHALPKNLAALFVEGIDHPSLTRAIFGGVAVAVKTGPEGRIWVSADCAGHKDLVTPNDGTRMREPGNRGAPKNVLTSLRVPPIREMLSLCYARSLLSAE